MTISRTGRRLVQQVAGRLGVEIRRVRVGPAAARTSMGQSYAHLKSLGFEPKTVVDVGVAGGTQELYDNFPSAYFLLVEPLAHFENDLKSILRSYRGTYVLAAAGASDGELEFNVHDTHLEGSSMYRETMGSAADGHAIRVPVRRLDDMSRQHALQGPYLLKVDVQGAELDVLEGAQEVLNDTEAVVLEVSLFGFMKGAPQFYDVIAYMKAHGFVAYDILHGWNRPLDGALGQVDIVFVKEHGRFRRDHAYADPLRVSQ